MSNSPTVPATPTEPDDAGLWRDGQPFDGPRAMATIVKQREREQQHKAEIKARDVAIVSLLANRPVTPAVQAVIDAATVPTTTTDASTDTLATIASILGADPTDAASVVEAATQARLSGELYGIMVEQHADPKLTRAVLNDSRALVGIDLSADDVHEQLTAVVADALKDHPQLKVRQMAPSVAGFPMAAGSGGLPQGLTRESLSWMSPQAIDDARRAGLIPGVGKPA